MKYAFSVMCFIEGIARAMLGFWRWSDTSSIDDFGTSFAFIMLAMLLWESAKKERGRG